MKTRRGRVRLLTTAALATLATTASANGAMGYALEMFDFRTWSVYVAATILFEAWFIGRWLTRGWLNSLLISLVANLITAFGCWQCVIPALHQSFVGSPINPNPLVDALVLFTGFGASSALVETFVWNFARKTSGRGERQLLGRSFLAHLIGVPLAFCILLVPSRPYHPLELWTQYERRTFWVRSSIKDAFQAFVQSNGRLPNRMELEQMVGKAAPDGWVVFYAPNYGRFDMGEARREPLKISWNEKAMGKKVDPDTLPIWLLRVDAQYPWGVDYDGERLRFRTLSEARSIMSAPNAGSS